LDQSKIDYGPFGQLRCRAILDVEEDVLVGGTALDEPVAASFVPEINHPLVPNHTGG
jgi:hypothetical protein